MILILFAIVAAVILTTAMFWFAGEGCDGANTLAGILGVVMGIATGFAAICYVFAGWSWLASDYKAQIINREYKTNYTRAEVFYASDVIDTIRELDRKRIELNGDVMRPSAD